MFSGSAGRGFLKEFTVLPRGHFFVFTKLTIEIGKIIETMIKRNFCYAQLALNKILADPGESGFLDELVESVSCATFEEPAKCLSTHVNLLCDFSEADGG